MILHEVVEHYTDEDIIELINNSKLKSNSKNLLINLTKEISIYLLEMYHQINRQPVNLEIYKDLQKLNTKFAEVIITYVSTENITKDVIIKTMDDFTTKLNDFLSSATNVVNRKALLQLNSCYNNIVKHIKLFIPRSNCIVANSTTEKHLQTNNNTINAKTINSLSSMFTKETNSTHINNYELETSKPTRAHIVRPSRFHNNYIMRNNKRRF